ncbi:biotin-dependent carboxyltransferase family protein [Bacillaceae bacterium Marseille-Q3522]|nr:biotin-dependent carboxyltransferase family protein [Bacillaceae bacterium Marseille-Q3522]
MRIVKPGLLTTIQDLGRYGYQKYGVIASGAMDMFAHRLANLLVGNEESEATLEITLLGPVIEFTEDSLISICGGNFSPSINKCPVQLWRPILVKKGSFLSFAAVKDGCRAYLAVSGGYRIKSLMESKSTYLRAGIGGFKGRALKEGDELQTNRTAVFSLPVFYELQKKLATNSFLEMKWGVDPRLTAIYKEKNNIRIVRGRQFHLFTEQSRMRLLSEPFIVTTKSDRMGYRLQGATLELLKQGEMISEAVSFGTMQVPPEGNPIVLMADRQTTGGYPKIAQVASVDLPLMAQAKPGDRLWFHEISHEEAEKLYLEREGYIEQLKTGISLIYHHE